MKKLLVATVAIATTGTLLAGPLKGHGNMKEAHNKIHAAIEAMERAQKANHYDLAGHAAKAEALLREAEKEIELAAETANAEKK